MKVYFVGAGPGDPDLLTIKAEQLIRRARICIYAGSLISPAVLACLPQETEKHDSAGMTLEQIIAVCLQARARDLDVVRLHTGDPSIYSAMGEQIRELGQQGIEYEVVPGVSAFQAAAAALRLELTVPETIQSVILTRTPGRTPMPEKENLDHLAQTGAALCFFLSAHAVEQTARSLAAHYGPDCPAALVYHASWPDQIIIRGTLLDIYQKIQAAGITKTAMFLVGRFPLPDGPRSRLYDAAFVHAGRPGGAT